MSNCITPICANQDQLYHYNVRQPQTKGITLMWLNTKQMLQSNVDPLIHQKWGKVIESIFLGGKSKTKTTSSIIVAIG